MASETLSIYFGIEDGAKADLEVVAEAILHWAAAARIASGIGGNSAELKFLIVDATDGSLRLNLIFGWMEDQLSRIKKGSSKYPNLRAFAIGLALLVLPIVGERTYDALTSTEDVMSLSEEDRKLLIDLLDVLKNNEEYIFETKKFFQTIERDKAITGVGISESRDSKPLAFVPRNTFAERGGLWELQEDIQERTIFQDLDVVLVSPSLVSTPRAWLFLQEGIGEFSAKMADQRFLKALENNSVQEKLRTGINMKIRLQINQKKTNGEWTVKKKGRPVVAVLYPKDF